jgi:hypothetical protein
VHIKAMSSLAPTWCRSQRRAFEKTQGEPEQGEAQDGEPVVIVDGRQEEAHRGNVPAIPEFVVDRADFVTEQQLDDHEHCDDLVKGYLHARITNP